ncbi:hypothetical protein THAOC_34252 [Thalassiosira oceanica]|uniref:Uncharacterized protein n=1 Tax=Thalassiosira oceanica TaxID=159749 RepID=K0RD83_THAOC|nr:hypothetical protein THAOC_34252 [Thalassiosira oceanica]|eukprot:EJK47056.1 hypothetical protein THAOC_34252 [Thalassiosira oceanica]
MTWLWNWSFRVPTTRPRPSTNPRTLADDKIGQGGDKQASGILAHSNSGAFMMPWTSSPGLHPVHSHLSSLTLSIPIGSHGGKHTMNTNVLPRLTPQHLIIQLKSLPILQPGSLQFRCLYGAMDFFQAFRPVHSHLPSLTVPLGSGKTPLTPNAISSYTAASHHSARILPILQPGSLKIQRLYGV